eukprot:5623090-Lingulodinium_polyedra.AAC.1
MSTSQQAASLCYGFRQVSRISTLSVGCFTGPRGASGCPESVVHQAKGCHGHKMQDASASHRQ